MFLHNLRYELLINLRARDLIIWLMLFPIFLGVVFKIGFGSIYEKDTLFNSIPVAIVENVENETFRSVTESVSEEGSALLKPIRTDEATALEMLKNDEIEGIIYVGDRITLTVAGKGIQETILKAFIEQYSVYESIITDAIKNDPSKAPAVIKALSENVTACTDIPVTQGNTDQFIQYFYNLIAMVAIFGSVTGLHITETNQANMSALGARRNISPVPKSVSLSASLIGSCIAQTVCTTICVTFLAFVLRVDFGERLPLVYLAAAMGGCMGVTMGFFVGSIGKLSSELKNAISMSVSMIMCFLSGLMVGNMKGIIAENAPWINSVNPVALISDCFYCLNLYSDLDRFGIKMISMLIWSVIFSVLGIVLSRRKKYASI